MVFSTNNLYRQENIIDNTPNNTITIKVSENTSLFINALHYILEENIMIENELSKYNLSTYINKKISWLQEDNILSNIMKNGINIKISTGLGDKASGFFQKVKTNLTIENIVKFIITGFIKLIVRIWREFEIICMNFVSKNSQIRRYAKKINDIGVNITYNAPMFTYTHILDDTSRTDLEDQLNKIYDELVKFINTFKSLNSANDIERAINDFNQTKSYDEDYYSEIRGQLLGTNSLIDEEDYNEALFKYFRNGSSTTTTNNTISPESIRARYNSWDKAPKIIKTYTRDKSKLEKAGNNLVDKLNRYHIDSYIKEVPTTTLDLYSDLVNRYAHKIKNTCNIFLLFYTQKLDAAKDELATNKNILMEAIKYIIREGL